MTRDYQRAVLFEPLSRGWGEEFTPFVALVNNVQFDTVSRVMGWQSRFRWILRPGNDLYVVYTHNCREDPLVDRFASVDRMASSKLLYTHRF